MPLGSWIGVTASFFDSKCLSFKVNTNHFMIINLWNFEISPAVFNPVRHFLPAYQKFDIDNLEINWQLYRKISSYWDQLPEWSFHQHRIRKVHKMYRH